MLRHLNMKGATSPLHYALLAPFLVLSQHGLVALAYQINGTALAHDREFWLLPLGRLAVLPGLAAPAAGLAFAFCLAIAWALAVASFRRANDANRGHRLAALSVVPTLQILVVIVLALIPHRGEDDDPDAAVLRARLRHNVQGVIAGVAIIVFAVLVSAITFGAYGWGLFVLTPFTVGLTTAYIGNRNADLGLGPTVGLVMQATALGGLALIMFALEGLVCILLIAPLAAIAALLGAALGRPMALAGHHRGSPFLAVALLPAAFVLEAAMPPGVEIATHESIDIAAPPSAVWQALISEEPIAAPPGLVGRAGLAYPISGRIFGTDRGAIRLGEFSTGTARERITEWEPGRRLAFEVLGQPPAMEEMSPYRRVLSPHVHGYFSTDETRFTLEPLRGGGTRLTVQAAHILRIDPVLYWEPIARWAAHENTRRVLRDISSKAGRANLPDQERASRAVLIASRSVS